MDILVEATVAHYLNIDFAGAGKLCEVRKREGGGAEEDVDANYLCLKQVMLLHAATSVERVAVYEIQMQFHIQQVHTYLI